MKNSNDVNPFILRSSSNSSVSLAPTDCNIYLVKAFTYSGVRTLRQAICPRASKHETLRSFDSHCLRDWEINGSTENIRPSCELALSTSERNEPNHLVCSSPLTSMQNSAQRQKTRPFCLAIHLTKVCLSILWPWYANS